jgi:hypothetical protein
MATKYFNDSAVGASDGNFNNPDHWFNDEACTSVYGDVPWTVPGATDFDLEIVSCTGPLQIDSLSLSVASPQTLFAEGFDINLGLGAAVSINNVTFDVTSGIVYIENAALDACTILLTGAGVDVGAMASFLSVLNDCVISSTGRLGSVTDTILVASASALLFDAHLSLNSSIYLGGGGYYYGVMTAGVISMDDFYSPLTVGAGAQITPLDSIGMVSGGNLLLEAEVYFIDTKFDSLTFEYALQFTFNGTRSKAANIFGAGVMFAT